MNSFLLCIWSFMKFSRNMKCVDKLLVYGLLLFLFGGIIFLLSNDITRKSLAVLSVLLLFIIY